MTKMSRPEIEIGSYRMLAACKVFRTSGNTGGTIIIGIGWHIAGGTATAANNAKINLDNLTAGVWTQFEFYFAPSTITWSNVMVGLVEIHYLDPITGGSAYVAELIVDETQHSPGVPQKVPDAGSYTLKAEDNGKHIYIDAGGVVIPLDSVQYIPIETCITIVNNSGSAQTISKGDASINLYKATTGNVTSVSLAAYGICTLLKTATNNWNVTGAIT